MFDESYNPLVQWRAEGTSIGTDCYVAFCSESRVEKSNQIRMQIMKKFEWVVRIDLEHEDKCQLRYVKFQMKGKTKSLSFDSLSDKLSHNGFIKRYSKQEGYNSEASFFNYKFQILGELHNSTNLDSAT